METPVIAVRRNLPDLSAPVIPGKPAKRARPGIQIGFRVALDSGFRRNVAARGKRSCRSDKSSWKHHTIDRGFTLVEIAIVLVVLGLLLASFIGPLSTRVEQAERERTRAMLEEIKEALYGFAIAQGRLPCPDSDNGREDFTAGVCTGEPVGNLPWVDLAVPEEDAWGRRFRYRVTPSYADAISRNTVEPPTPPCTTQPTQASFALCSDGDITIRSDGVDTSPTTEIATKVAAVVISHGMHRFLPAAASPHEDENFEVGDTLRTFVSRDYTGGTGEEFDDLVVWISPLILKNRMIMAGKLP